MSNKQLTEELHKPNNRKFKKQKNSSKFFRSFSLQTKQNMGKQRLQILKQINDQQTNELWLQDNDIEMQSMRSREKSVAAGIYQNLKEQNLQIYHFDRCVY